MSAAIGIGARKGFRQAGEGAPMATDKEEKRSLKEPDFPNIRARNDFDFDVHVRKAMEAGMSREEAEAHAREDMAGEHEARIDAYAQESRRTKRPASKD